MRGDRINTPATPEAAYLVHATEGTADIQTFALTTENYRPDLVHQAARMDRYPLAGYSIDIILIDQSSVMFAIVHEAPGAVATENVAD
jgi:hypothetical protein